MFLVIGTWWIESSYLSLKSTGITDPTVIPTDKKNSSGVKRLLKRSLNSTQRASEALNLSAIWKRSQEQNKQTRILQHSSKLNPALKTPYTSKPHNNITNPTIPIFENDLNKILKMIQNQFDIFTISPNFTKQLLQGNDQEALLEKHFLSDHYQYSMPSNTELPPTDCEYLIIPLNPDDSWSFLQIPITPT